MDELSPLRLFIMRSAFVALTVVIVFFHLLPIDTQPVTLFAPQLFPPLVEIDPAEARLRDLLDLGTSRHLVGPDLLIAFGFAWSLRRPEYVPTLLLAVLFLMADLMLQRPPGLWALLALLACENLKGRSRILRDSTFGAEWVAVAILLTGILLANRFVLFIMMVPTPQLRLSLLELGITVLIYPVVVFVTRSVMGVRRAAPGELDSLGGRA
jgi:rod shape-determining protein MreD